STTPVLDVEKIGLERERDRAANGCEGAKPMARRMWRRTLANGQRVTGMPSVGCKAPTMRPSRPAATISASQAAHCASVNAPFRRKRDISASCALELSGCSLARLSMTGSGCFLQEAAKERDDATGIALCHCIIEELLSDLARQNVAAAL